MKTLLLLLCTMALAMSAQTINGVSIGMDAENSPTIVNKSDKSVMGYSVQRNTSEGSHTIKILDFDWLANGTRVKPGETKPLLGLLGVFFDAQPTGYELKSVLFDDGTFYGADLVCSVQGTVSIWQDFTRDISAVRSMAHDVQYSADKYNTLEHHKAAFSHGRVTVKLDASTDIQALYVRSDMADTILKIRDYFGEAAAEAAITRVAGLADLMKGQQK